MDWTNYSTEQVATAILHDPDFREMFISSGVDVDLLASILQIEVEGRPDLFRSESVDEMLPITEVLGVDYSEVDWRQIAERVFDRLTKGQLKHAQLSTAR